MIDCPGDLSALAPRIFLNPGDFYFSSSGQQITTILGSCIAITLWHPVLHIGGMCHFVMPAAPASNLNSIPAAKAKGYYADDALLLFKHEVESRGTSLMAYEAKVFGGGHSQARVKQGTKTIGDQNIIAAITLLARHKMTIKATHLGESRYRRLIFDTNTGDVWLKHEQIS